MFEPSAVEQFTLDYYEDFCNILSDKKEYDVFTVNQYFDGDFDSEKVGVILTHDCDLVINIELAEIEYRNGIHSTYFIRDCPPEDIWKYEYRHPETIAYLKSIQSIGFEIGFHYESLNIANPTALLDADDSEVDFEAGRSVFENQLEELRSFGLNIRSVAAHGRQGITQQGEIITLANNYRLFDKERTFLEDNLNVRERADIKKDIYISDASNSYETRELFYDPIQKIREANQGDILLFNLHSMWWFDYEKSYVLPGTILRQ
jgi:hypothetical protein